MDRLIYQAMSGAKAMLQRQDALSNNLANASTAGFKADLMAFRAVPVRQEGTATTRVYSLEASAGFDPQPGTQTATGNPLDIAVQGEGYIAVQGLDGNEAYTRDGSMQIGADGTLQSNAGLPILSDGGPISVPQGAQVTIGLDGTVNAMTPGQPVTQVGRIKLVNPPAADLTKGLDGMLRTTTGDPVPADETVKVASGVQEGSNVNVVESMVGMIAVSRQFEMQMQMMQRAEQNAQHAAQLLAPPSS